MYTFLEWLFNKFSYFLEQMLLWKILGNFSLLHLLLGGVFLTILLKFITFGQSNIGGTADYIGSIRRTKNSENVKDKKVYNRGYREVSKK